MFRSENRRPQLTKRNDPEKYGHICPHCNKRYGIAHEYITLQRCDTCPAFKDFKNYYNVNIKSKKKKQLLKGL